MADWATISSLATAGGTLVLAVATFGAVRSSNRSARIAEQALLEQRRPIIVHSRIDDAAQKIGYGDGHWVSVPGSGASFEEADGVIYLALSLRNVGAGIGVLQGWHIGPRRLTTTTGMPVEHTEVAQFRNQTRDLYIPNGDIGLWQGALRDRDEELFAQTRQALRDRSPMSVELLYTDQLGGQRTISLFAVSPAGPDAWLVGAARHWYLDGAGPR